MSLNASFFKDSNIILMYNLCFITTECERNVRFFLLNLEDVMLLFCYFFLKAESWKAVKVRNNDQADSQTFMNNLGKVLRSGRQVSQLKQLGLRKKRKYHSWISQGFRRKSWREGNFTRSMISQCQNSSQKSATPYHLLLQNIVKFPLSSL